MNARGDGRPATEPDDLTGGQRLARNSLLNITGYCAPLVVAAVTVPLIIRGMGTQRFGIITLAWAFIGYFSLFDFGLNRALTKMVAELLGRKQEEAIPSLIRTALLLMLALGVTISLGFALATPWLVHQVLNIPAGLQAETRIAFFLLAFSLPAVILSVGLQGVLSAYQRFDLVNAVRIPMAIFTFLAPVAVIRWYGNAIHPVVAVLILGRLCGLAAQLWLCHRIVPAAPSGTRFQRTLLRPLLTFGGWVTVINVVTPLMIYMDRFFISALLSAATVAFYATPNEAVTKIWYLPWALLGVLFPAFSTTLVRDADRAAALFDKGGRFVFAVLFPIVLLAVAYAYEGLLWWLGIDFAVRSTLVLQWMAVGVFMHGLSLVPAALLQGAGRPDLIAKTHLVELPLFAVALWAAIRLGGLNWAAGVWALRLALDAGVLSIFAKSQLPRSKERRDRHWVLVPPALLCFLLVARMDGLLLKSIVVTVILLAFAWFTRGYLLDREDRAAIKKLLSSGKRRKRAG